MICEIKSGDEAECIDRQPTGERSLPEPDTEGDPELGFESMTIERGWTTVTFLKPTVPEGDQDYDLASASGWRAWPACVVLVVLRGRQNMCPGACWKEVCCERNNRLM